MALKSLGYSPVCGSSPIHASWMGAVRNVGNRADSTNLGI